MEPTPLRPLARALRAGRGYAALSSWPYRYLVEVDTSQSALSIWALLRKLQNPARKPNGFRRGMNG